MARGGKTGKRKIPHRTEDLLVFEDRLQAIQAIFREIRGDMKEVGLAEFELMSGTLLLRLDQLTEAVADISNECRKQIGVQKMKNERERRLAMRASESI